jgi:cytoskeletal protein RodZ
MKHDQRGSSAIAVIVVVIIVGALAAAGWFTIRSFTSEGDDAAPESVSTQKGDNSGNQSSKLATYTVPEGWTLDTQSPPSVDDFFALKSELYATEYTPDAGAVVTKGGIITVALTKTNESSVLTLNVPAVRGIPLQTKITNGEIVMEDVEIGTYDASAYTAQYESTSVRVIEFIHNGIFVHAKLDTAAEERTQPEYEQFVKVLSSLQLK